ncbi:Fur family transcriptional regulator [Streptococcus thoraltensis]|uniref:Fur family transcriptional regulator n=1 Tax=Streptococcus thoraltensis TaxID=55085 RepID=UPI00035F80AB|nr:Fur family transcriptional regulator [Streptococcus thoraltensis]MDY4761969.1 Fur family transcriptional regulator [Streptococcus thoraltensis]
MIDLTEELEVEYQAVLAHFRKKHSRITESRKAILAYMIAANHHPSAEQVYKDLSFKYPSLSLATVYNNLRVLVDEGFVTEIKVTNDKTTYFDYKGHDHINVICENCGKISDLEVELPDIAHEVASQTGYHITKSQFLIYGICENCQKEQEERL